MIKKTVFAIAMLASSATASFATDFGQAAGTYTGKTAKGNAISITVPKSGTPTYRFAGSTVAVASASFSGKTIKMNVGPGGHGLVVVKLKGKDASYEYSAGQGTTTASLTKN